MRKLLILMLAAVLGVGTVSADKKTQTLPVSSSQKNTSTSNNNSGKTGGKTGAKTGSKTGTTGSKTGGKTHNTTSSSSSSSSQSKDRVVDLGSGLKYNLTNNTFTYRNNSYKMIFVPGGSFTMGATGQLATEAYDREFPTHKVTLSDYYLGATEVPQWLWEVVMGENPSRWKGDNMPVESVSWYECETFVKRLNTLIGNALGSYEFAMPTEAQWEFAAREGKSNNDKLYSGSNYIDDVCWYSGNSSNRTHPIATKSPNSLGFYDMSGNVWERCYDWFGTYPSEAQYDPIGPSSGTTKVVRGRGYSSPAKDCRVSEHANGGLDSQSDFVGFRLAISKPHTAKKSGSTGSSSSSTSNIYNMGNGLKYNKSTNTIQYGDYSYKMVMVPGGSFTMGATGQLANEARDVEFPTHRVTLSTYYMGQTEVPQWLWKAVMGTNPSSNVGEDYPVENISWEDCMKFVRTLNGMMGNALGDYQFRMPTEAQWEFAAREGKSNNDKLYSGSNNINDVAWYTGNSNNRTHPVASKKPNSLGLYDMCGNVWECVYDWYDSYPSESQYDPEGPISGSTKCVRGRGYSSSAKECRVSDHANTGLTGAYDFMGFRLAMANGPSTQNAGSSSSSANKPAPSIVNLGNGLKYDKSSNTFMYDNYSYKMIHVPGGSFTMGATGQLATNASKSEFPTHRVTLSDYYLGATEVPQWLWRVVMGENPSRWIGDNLPVEKVSWYDCMDFVRKLNNMIGNALGGKSFCMPTEAQWEFAAREGKSNNDKLYSGSNYIDDVCWYSGNSGNRTHPVASKKPNSLGFYDMSGNVWERCFDWYDTYPSSSQYDPTGPSDGSTKVVRGRGYSSSANECRVSDHANGGLDSHSDFVGFRLALQ